MSEEYSYWEAIFKTDDFQSSLLSLKKKLQNKKVVLYGNGIFFDALADAYDLNKFFNIIGVSDIRYETSDTETHKGFKCIKPSKLKDFSPYCIIVTSPNPKTIKKYLFENSLCQKSTVILPLDFCTTNELKIKRNYENVLKRLQKKSKLRVLFVCEENAKWGYQSLYDELKNNEDFEVLPVALFPIYTKNRVEFTQKENIEFFKSRGVKAIDAYDYEKNENKNIKLYEPDLVFYQQPWYLMSKNHPKFVSQYALCMMIPYGYTTLDETFWGSDAIKEVYRSLWMFFSESEYHNKFYKKAANIRSGDNLYAAGSLKLDAYNKPLDDKITACWKSDTNPKGHIIWAPHHSVADMGLRMSTFEYNYIFFLDFAKNHPQYSFVLKPHPALCSACAAAKIMSEKEYDDYIGEWKNLKNASVCTDGGYFDIFRTSDVLITDCSSFLAEYFPTQKPIILLDKKNRAPFDKFGEKLKKGFYVINDIEELEARLYELLIKKNDPLKDTRTKVLKESFYMPKNGVSNEILGFLRDRLGRKNIR